jgi:PBP1b-binding outer membrane lipoprotein LpoB
MKTFIVTLFTLSIILFVGCKKEDPKQVTSQTVAQTEVKSVTPDSSIIRSNTVDVASLDINKDGKVFQCPMHYEVISDKSGTCPLCKMDLEEVSVETAVKNLK